ncbi:MAG: exodeoxyribonuclease small subunit XseB [Rickettsiaceae bacterium]|jgi:exodeoxyribonuclease VII small subunit|nr:exodeoxyribonuclease small subunit XseB [Rickettsiaceae bacterium]
MTKSKTNIEKIEKLDFETALSKLEEIVEKLGSGKIDLEEMVDLYEQGTALRDHCSKKLSEAKMKVEVLMKKDSGN